jgi:transposase
LGIAVGTEFLWQTRHRETGDVIRQVGSGRQRKVTPEEAENIALVTSAKLITTAQEIAGKI